MEPLVHILLSNALAATVMAVVVAALTRMCQRPALTHSLWLLVMLKLVTPPLVLVALPVVDVISPIRSSQVPSLIDHNSDPGAKVETLLGDDTDESTPIRSDALIIGAPASLANTDSDFARAVGNQRSPDLSNQETHVISGRTSGSMWEPLILVVVLAGALGWWTLATMRIIQFQRLLKDAQPMPHEWQSHANDLAEQIGLGWHPSVCLVPGRVPPMLWAIGSRPRLLVPSMLWTEIGAGERTSLLLHELAHLKRRDHWVRLLELIAAGLYWWHPVAWWARRALREAEEQCCDAWVVWAMPERARTYAAALLAAVEFVSGAPTAPAAASATSGSGHVSCLKRRLKMIVRAKTPKGLSWAGRIAVLGMAALVLPLAPSWAQNSKTPLSELDRLTGVDVASRSTEAQHDQDVSQRGEKIAEDRVVEELNNDPELLALTREIDTAREHLRNSQIANRDLMEGLKGQLAKLGTEIGAKRSALKDLYEKGRVAVLKPKNGPNAENNGRAIQPIFKTVSENLVEKMTSELNQTDLQIIETESMLDVKRDAYKASQEPNQQVDGQRLALIEEEFKKDPEVVTLKKEMDDTLEQLEYTKRSARQGHDAARVAAQTHLDKLKQEYKDLWESKRAELLAQSSGPRGKQSLATIEDLKQKLDTLKKKKEKQVELFKKLQIDQKLTNDDTFEAAYLQYQLISLQNWEEQVKKNIEQLNFEARLVDEVRLRSLTERYEKLRKRKHDQLLALLTKDDDKDDDKQEKARDAAERFQEQLKDLIGKLGKELSPVAEEVRKSLDQALGEIHKSLEKDSLSVDDVAKALDKSYEDLRKAFEGGGPVNKELREAIEKARKDMQQAFDRARGDVEEQVETLRQRSRELRDQARDDLRRGRGEPEKGTSRDTERQPNRDELESARREIRDLEQKLRSATRRLEELEQRHLRRNPMPRRERNPQTQARPENPTAPRTETTPPEQPREPTAPATPARPSRPIPRRALPPGRPIPNFGRRGPQIENDSRLRELEEKMNRLLKELESLKDEKNPKDSKDAKPSDQRPAKPASAVTS